MAHEYKVEMLNIEKNFPGVKALRNVDFQLKYGEIHGLIGENGAGKSTLIKVLAGIYTHDNGEVKFDGRTQEKISPKSVEESGIYFIHQERFIVPTQTVAEALFLGIEPVFSPFKLVRRRFMEKEAERILEEMVDISISGRKLVAELTVAEQQLLQICRALIQNPEVIVFDEPTAVLAKQETDNLFQIIRNLRKKGISIVYISHYFGEILDICDRITVLRDGAKIDTVHTRNLSIEDIVYMIAGRAIDESYFKKDWQIGKPLLTVHGLTHKKDFRDVSFQIRSGEIVGITGLMGSGHISVGMSIYDSKHIIGGEMEFNGKRLSRINPKRAVSLGIAYVPEDRRNHGIVKNLSVRENMTLSSLSKVSKGNVISQKKEYKIVDQLIEQLNVRTPDREEEIGFLSGGNQQKVVMAKWLNSDARLYILNQPTAAVDVGTKAEIYSLIGELAREGAGVLVVSQDLKELEVLSDRALVMYRGGLLEELTGSELNTERMMISMMGDNADGTSISAYS